MMATVGETWKRNMPFFQEQIVAVLGSSSIVVKGICTLLIIFYFISFSETAVSYISIVPGSLLPPNFYIIPLATSYFLELHFWDVIIDLVIIILCGKLLEPLWGAMEVLVFFFLTNVIVSIIMSLLYLLLYVTTFNTDYLFETRLYGMVGFIAGFSVAVKQIMADHVLINLCDVRFRNKHIPMCILLLSISLWLIGFLRSTYSLTYGFGILISWIYLRFYQPHANGTKGDMAESFTFASFFPELLQHPVSIVSNTVFDILVKVKICKKIVRKYDISSPNSIRIDLPGTSQDTERRRQKALKALNDRLKEKEPDWPSIVDSSDKSSAVGNSREQDINTSKVDTPARAMVDVHATVDSPLQPLSPAAASTSAAVDSPPAIIPNEPSIPQSTP